MSDTVAFSLGGAAGIALGGCIAYMLARRALRRQRLHVYCSAGNERVGLLSPGRQITDPDDAEHLGLTADARRMRQQRERS